MYTKATKVSIWSLYLALRLKVPQWFKASTALEETDYPGFIRWIQSNISGWYSHPSGYVLVKDRGHIREIHPVFFRLIDEQFLRHSMANTLIEFIRIECPIINPKGRSMRRMLKKLGFQQEGIMKAKECYFDIESGSEVYLDVELWATVKERS